MTDGTPDPFGALTVPASATHEIYCAYMAAGFTASQALYLVGVMLSAAISGQAGTAQP